MHIPCQLRSGSTRPQLKTAISGHNQLVEHPGGEAVMRGRDSQTLALALEAAWKQAQTVLGKGRVASYIPELAKADACRLGAVVLTREGEQLEMGDAGTPFTLQSVAKVIALTLAISRLGAEAVFERVGMEPTGDPFNSLVKLEAAEQAKPLNPMINAGAIAICGLLAEKMGFKQAWRELEGLALQMCRQGLFGVNETVHRSEYDTAHRNLALAHLLRELGILKVPPERVVDLYVRLCALEVNCYGLAHMGLFFTHPSNSVPPTGAPTGLLRIVNTFLVTCGMYDESGEFAIRVGIPAKSGVSGAIMALVPGDMAIGVIGPALDAKGNSIGGVALLAHLSEALDLSMF